MTRFHRSRILAIALAVSCGSAAFVPWGSEVAHASGQQASHHPGLRPWTSGPVTRAVAATGNDPLAVAAAAAYRALVLSHTLRAEADDVGLDDLRADVAREVARRIGVDADRLLQRWTQADDERQLALFAGLSQVGVPYRRLASRPGVGFDCSGLTSFAWSMVGEELPRSSRAQVRSSERITADEAQPGDLVYYPGHVMMSLGLPGAVLHSPEPGRRVEVRLSPEHRARRWVYADPLA